MVARPALSHAPSPKKPTPEKLAGLGAVPKKFGKKKYKLKDYLGS
jgi:hypothetical protein